MRSAAVLLAAWLAMAAQAQGTAPRPTAGHERLAALVGQWTLKGQESRFRETCEWFDGHFHVVCHSQTTRADGSIGRGMSILGYLPAEDAYTYHGIGARGRNVTHRGRFRDGMLEFTQPPADGAPATRIRLGPLGKQHFAITEEVQSADGNWTRRSDGQYVRLD